MRHSEFEAICPHLQAAFDCIDADLKRSQALHEKMHEWFPRWPELPEGTPSDLKPRAPTDEERAELSRSCAPRIQDACPWRHIATEAAVWLRDAGWTPEAKAIGKVLSGLPTGPVDGNQPEILNAQFNAIRAGGERICTILAACMARGPNSQDGIPEPQRADGNKPKRKRKRRPRASNGPTPRQLEVVQLYGECKGNFAEVARRLGINAKTARQHYSAAAAKLGQQADTPTRKTGHLSHDRRGQLDVSDIDDARRENDSDDARRFKRRG